jgi:hypothetical protein
VTVQYSAAVRDAKNDVVETTIGTSPKLQIRTGAQPASCAAADSGQLLCEITLPSDWMAPSSGGVKAKAGTWSGTAVAAGTAAHYRIKDSAGTICHEQGSVGRGSGDMSCDNTNIAIGQTVTVNSYTKTSGNA